MADAKSCCRCYGLGIRCERKREVVREEVGSRDALTTKTKLGRVSHKSISNHKIFCLQHSSSISHLTVMLLFRLNKVCCLQFGLVQN